MLCELVKHRASDSMPCCNHSNIPKATTNEKSETGKDSDLALLVASLQERLNEQDKLIKKLRNDSVSVNKNRRAPYQKTNSRSSSSTCKWIYKVTWQGHVQPTRLSSMGPGVSQLW